MKDNLTFDWLMKLVFRLALEKLEKIKFQKTITTFSFQDFFLGNYVRNMASIIPDVGWEKFNTQAVQCIEAHNGNEAKCTRKR